MCFFDFATVACAMKRRNCKKNASCGRSAFVRKPTNLEQLNEQTIITAAFPEARAAIAALRRVDGEFDELCSDFVVLTRIAAAENAKRTEDILESLADLKQEIETELQARKNNNMTKKDTTNEIT